MHPVLSRFLRQTTLGVVAIIAVMPFAQRGAVSLTAAPAPELVVSGDVADLVPGRPGTLRLTVRNDGADPARVRRLTAVPDEGVVGCALTVEPWTGALSVPARGSATQDLVVRVVGSRCQGASWRLSYTAT